MNKYNFKVGDCVEIYRKPVDGLGADISELPPIGSKGKIIDCGVYYCGKIHYYCGKIQYVYISFYSGYKNGSFYWAIPCSCLKRVKEVKDRLVKD